MFICYVQYFTRRIEFSIRNFKFPMGLNFGCRIRVRFLYKQMSRSINTVDIINEKNHRWMKTCCAILLENIL